MSNERGLRRTFSSLQGRNYRLFFMGQVISLTGTWMQRVAQDWLILELTGNAVALSVGVAMQSVPVLLFGMWGGVLVDRLDKRRLLLWAQAVSGVLALTLGLLTLTGAVELWMVYALAFALGLVTIVEQPGRSAFVHELVGPTGLANAVSLTSSMNNAARLVGPAVGGLLITTVGVAWTFLLNAASFIAVILALLAMDVTALQREVPVGRARRQVREALRYAWGAPQLRAPLLMILIISVFAQNFRIVLPLMADDVFARGAAGYGTLMAMLGLGALAGALACAHYAKPTQRMLLMIAGGFGTVSLMAALAPSWGVLVGLVILAGAGHTSFNTTSNALVQLRSAPALRGRVLGLRTILTMGTHPVGAPLIGVICELFGARAGLAAGGLIALGVALGAARTVRLDRLEADRQVLSVTDAVNVQG